MHCVLTIVIYQYQIVLPHDFAPCIKSLLLIWKV